ncbi:MAG TPA: hypothetical protein H9908_07060 [Candidatus Rothia avistercoris]|uniref:Uncharacterized protein n=1 Tax=Candidatus Rothia avistercoris TaxID=2840479 RepID=A0A9D2ZTL8_9MICC|nr:hypothetical protein [Candidatus Rothia avistercoris]
MKKIGFSSSSGVLAAIVVVFVALSTALIYVLLGVMNRESTTDNSVQSGQTYTSRSMDSNVSAESPAISEATTPAVPQPLDPQPVSVADLEDGGAEYSGTGNNDFRIKDPSGDQSVIWVEVEYEPAHAQDTVRIFLESRLASDDLLWGYGTIDIPKAGTYSLLVNPYLPPLKDIDRGINTLRIETQGRWQVRVHPASQIPLHGLNEPIQGLGHQAFRIPPGATTVDISYSTDKPSEDRLGLALYTAGPFGSTERSIIPPSSADRTESIDLSNAEYVSVQAESGWTLTFR